MHACTALSRALWPRQAPLTCALCKPPCPTNIGTVVVDLFSALHTDILTALRLAAICVNPVACACQVMLMMKPSWMDALPNEVRQCKGSDIFSLIADKIMSMVIESQEAVINEYVFNTSGRDAPREDALACRQMAEPPAARPIKALFLDFPTSSVAPPPFYGRRFRVFLTERVFSPSETVGREVRMPRLPTAAFAATIRSPYA